MGSRSNPEVLSHYDTGLEQERLLRGAGELARARIQDLLARVLPPAPAIVIDVGDVTEREWILDTLRSIEEEPMVVAASAHPVGVAEVGRGRVDAARAFRIW